MVTLPPAEPQDLLCDSGEATCSGNCGDLAPWVSDGSGGDWDQLLALAPQDKLTLEGCKAKLRACQACLDRGRKAGLIR